MLNSDCFLFFSQQFDRDKGLDYGRLSLNSLERGVLDIWKATSSVASKQYAESFHERGGLIPPCYRCENLKKYTIETTPIPLPHIKGVEGNFYKINPHFVKTDKGGHRSDFGIHLDANVPGSLGCIVMSKKRFKNYESVMKKLRKKGIKQIPLFCQYS